MKLSIIIPCFNEQDTIEALLNKLLAVNFGSWKKEIIVVDDGSTDNSLDNIKQFKSSIKLLKHKVNMGKGSAIQTGLKHATGDAVVVQDADLEYDPNDLPKLLKEFEKGRADIIFGSRSNSLSKKDYLLYIWGINFSTFLINLLYGCRLTDIYTCYKLYRTDLFKLTHAKASGFERDIEMIVKLLKKGYKISEVSINYHPRNILEGKKIRPWDGILGLWVIIKERIIN